MSQENVETIRAAVEAWNRGAWDEALKDAAPGFELDNSSNRGEWWGVHRGVDAAKRCGAVSLEPWESMHIEVSEFIEGDEGVVVTRQKADFVLAATASRCLGRSAGVGGDDPRRQARSPRRHNDLDEALEAAGLQP